MQLWTDLFILTMPMLFPVLLFQLHREMQARASLGVISSPFAYLILVIVIMEILNGPVSALSDTAVLSSTRTKGDYGNCRFWASLAFNISGILSSAAMSVYGDVAVFIGYAVGSAVAFTAAWHLSFDKVHVSPAQDSPPQPDLLCRYDKNTALHASEACAHSLADDDDRNSLDVSTADSACACAPGFVVNEANPDSAADSNRSITIMQQLTDRIGGDHASMRFISTQDLQVWCKGPSHQVHGSTGSHL